MNRNDLFGAIEFIDDRIIENSEVKKAMKNQRKFTKGTIMLVAVLCLITVFATAVCAAKIFSLRDTLINTNDPEIKSEMSLAGFVDSNEYMAAAEWNAFAESYDPDGSIQAQVIQEGAAELDKKYDNYPVYTQEMADKIDEIAEKYGLTLHGSLKDMAYENWNTVIGDFVITDYDHEEFTDDAYSIILNGYVYDDGTFHYDGLFNVTGGRIPCVDYQFRRAAKGVFDTVFLNIGDIDDYEEQVLVTDSGVEFVAAISEYKSVIITEFDSCFVCINVMGGTDKGITFDDLKDMANTFDFSVIENVKGQPAQNNGESADNKPQPDVDEPEDADEAGWEQAYIEVSREGVVDKIPVDTVRVVNFDTTIAMDPEYFTHYVCEGVDTFSYDAWEGDAPVYYSVYQDSIHTAPELFETLKQTHSDNYSQVRSGTGSVGDYEALVLYFMGDNEHPDYNLNYYIIAENDTCYIIETQFNNEMSEGLYKIMVALFDTIKLG